VPPSIATSYSLFIVGFTSLVGAYKNYKKGLVNFKTAFIFGTSSIATVYLTRKLIIPHLPEVFFTMGTFQVTEPLLTMVVFAIFMLAASVSMIRNKQVNNINQTIQERNIFLVLFYGIAIGLVTGFLGVGGGFLLIPALVLIMKLPMKQAIGTALLIIAFNSLIGFTGDIGHYNIQWLLLITLTFIAIAGVIIGDALSKKIDGEKLKKGFGWFVLIMSIYILTREVFFNG
jgi:uncharacterized protein